jgi:general secretion pathway protein L
MSRKILGLDIRSFSATAVLMETGFKTCAISAYGLAPFPGEGTFHERLSETLTSISGNMDLRDCACALSIPSPRFFYRNISVPFGETKKINQMLPYELEALMARPVEDLLFDFNKIPHPGPEGETRLITAGIETITLKNILDTVEGCGIKPDIVFPGGYSQAKWIKTKLPRRESQIFIDIDSASCSLYLLLSGEVSLIRAIPLSSSQAPSAIHLWSQIQQSIAGFESLFEIKVSPEVIILNGIQNEKFFKQLETVSGITVDGFQLEPPENCSYPEDNGEIFSPSGVFNGALSNALFLYEGFKGMNFRKGPLSARNRIFEYRDRIIRTAVIAGILFLLWLTSSLIEIHLTQNKVDRLQAEILEIFQSRIPDSGTTEFPVHQMKTRIEDLKSAALGSGESGIGLRAIDLLNEISESLPDTLDVDISKFNLTSDEIYIEGTTATFPLVEEIKSKLQALDFIEEVTNRSPLKLDGDVVRFKLEIKPSGEEAS